MNLSFKWLPLTQLVAFISFTFLLLACQPQTELPCAEDKPGIIVDASFSIWQGINHQVATSPNGNRAALSCHNCYSDKDLNSANTMDLIRAAIDDTQNGRRADLIELDVQQFDTIDGFDLQVSHDYPFGLQQGPTLVEVLSNEDLSSASQILFIEIKPKDISKAFANKLLGQLTADYDGDGVADYAELERPLVIRASTNKVLEQIRRAIENDYPEFQDTIYLSRLFLSRAFLLANKDSMSTYVQQIAECGFHMTEFRDGATTPSNIAIAKSLGLAVNVFTLGVDDKSSIEKYRNLVDAITIDSGKAELFVFKQQTVSDMFKLATARNSIELLSEISNRF